jgi:hypothetical protein
MNTDQNWSQPHSPTPESVHQPVTQSKAKNDWSRGLRIRVNPCASVVPSCLALEKWPALRPSCAQPHPDSGPRGPRRRFANGDAGKSATKELRAFEQPAKLLLGGVMGGAFFALGVGHGFVVHSESFQAHDANVLALLFPELALAEFHGRSEMTFCSAVRSHETSSSRRHYTRTPALCKANVSAKTRLTPGQARGLGFVLKLAPAADTV